MAAEAQAFSWTFGGVLAGQPPVVAAAVLGVTALGGVGFVLWSYHRALVALPRGQRAALCVLRSLPWLGLLAILAAPTRVHRAYQDPPGARPLAVLVDRSGSMTAPDNRQRRRVDDALRRWRELEPAARRAHGEVKTFAFADGVQAAGAGATPAGLAAGQTKLYAGLQRVLAEAPPGGWAGVVTLTDGLDTSGTALSEGVDATTRAALGTSTALFFVPGRNRYAGEAFFGLRDFTAPAQVAPRTTFRVEATFDSFQSAARTVEVQFKVNGVARPATMLRLESGRRLGSWSAELPAGDAGELDLEVKAGNEVARAVVRVTRPATNRILYYQGALDWSYRFLADVLKRDASLKLTPVFNFPNPNAALPPGALRRMPEIPRELDGFEIVVLANAAASQFNRAQQAALAAWVSGGGVVLFFTPDDDSSQGFAGSELEQMLPVRFAPPTGGNAARRTLSSLRGGFGGTDTTELKSFDWEKTARVAEIFAEAERNKVELVAPLFSEYARVAAAKPGADVLARHPTDRVAGAEERAILLAIQRYGSGQSAVLTTDALWRWKLNRPSDDRSAEFFWHTLFAWLTRDRQAGLRFEEAPRVAQVDREIALRVAGATAAVQVEAVLGDRRLPLRESAIDGKGRAFRWRPPGAGLWQVTATDVDGSAVRHWIAVKTPLQSGELSGAAPDEELLRTLAARTGGAVLETVPPPTWQERPSERSVLLAERREPLWHRPWIFGAILGLYCTEMILRRKWRLL